MKQRKKTGLIVTLIVSVSVVLLLVFILPPISMHLLSLKLQEGPSVEQETSEMIMDALDLKTDAIRPVRAYDTGSRVVVRSHLYTPAMGLIHFRNLRYDEVFLKKADGTEQRLIKMERGHMETRPAQIALVSMIQKITNLITTMDFIQSDPVSDVVKAVAYKLYFISEDNEKISNENIYRADSREKDASKRIFRMRFTFKNKKYDKDKQYYLVAYDDTTGIESFRHPVIMDLAFADDFGFGF